MKNSVTKLTKDKKRTQTGLTATIASSKVAENASISVLGMFDMKPTVSTNRAVIVLGREPACTVTSRVANNWSLGTILISPVRALIRVVFPIIKKIMKYSRKNMLQNIPKKNIV